MSLFGIDWWGVFNKLWLMAAAGNAIWSLLPQLFLLMPNLQKDISSSNNSSEVPVSTLFHQPFPEYRRLQMKEEARRMFYWGYDNYIVHAFPFDELNPIDCSGRGHDWADE